MNILITNRSAWPDWAINEIVPWVVKMAGISWDYRVVLSHTKLNTWYGRGWKYHQKVVLHRRFGLPGGPVEPDFLRRHYFQLWLQGSQASRPKFNFPFQLRDWRYKTAPDRCFIRSRLELLVFLLAHEAYHAAGGNRSNFTRNGRCDVRLMELDCNAHGAQCVDAFRIAWPQFLARFRSNLRKQRLAASPSLALERKRAALVVRLDTWQRKAKRAQTALKKIQRQLRYYDGKLAALNGGAK